MLALTLEDQSYYDKMLWAVNPYGDGPICNRIIRALMCDQVEWYGV